MTDHSDVVIAGAGVIGLTTAWYLRARGATVTVLDAGAAGREASWAGGGILWPIYPWRYPESVRALAARGAELYPGLCRALSEVTGIDPEWRRSGVLLLDRGEREAAAAWAGDSGWACKPYSASELREALPGVNASEGGIHLPDAAQVRNPRLCRALVEALRAEGVPVLEHAPARSVALENGRFAGFRTREGVVPGGAGVIAAGVWSGGIEGAERIPALKPVKGQMLLLSGRPCALPHILVRRGRYAIPRADGRILVGSTLEDAGFDRTPTPQARARLIAAAEAMMPALAGLAIETHWAGLRPATGDGEPFMDAVPGTPGLFASVGHYRNGLVNAPAAAERLAARIADRAGQTPQ